MVESGAKVMLEFGGDIYAGAKVMLEFRGDKHAGVLVILFTTWANTQKNADVCILFFLLFLLLDMLTAASPPLLSCSLLLWSVAPPTWRKD